MWPQSQEFTIGVETLNLCDGLMSQTLLISYHFGLILVEAFQHSIRACKMQITMKKNLQICATQKKKNIEKKREK